MADDPTQHDDAHDAGDSGAFELEPVPVPPVPPVSKSVMDGIDEDAAAEDVAVDPEPAAATGVVAGARRFGRRPSEPETPRDALVRADFVPIQVVSAMGILALVAAVIIGFMHASVASFMTSLLLLYKTLMLSGAGFVALLLTAWFTRRPIGNAPLGAARVFLAVALAQLFLAFQFQWPINLDGWLVAPLLYAAAIVALFRLAREELTLFLGVHLALWLVLYAGPALQTAVATASVAG